MFLKIQISKKPEYARITINNIINIQRIYYKSVF